MAGLLLVMSLLLYWPGYAMYDSVDQFGQVLSGDFNDWHPPIMARLWALLHAAFGGGAAPIFVLQMALYWLGLALLAAALAGTGRRWGGWLVLAIGAMPLFLGWQAAVLKDAQMAGALLAALGLIAWWRLAARRLPWAAGAATAVLFAYATLVRANAVFATVPLAVLALAPHWRCWRQAAVAIGGIVAVLALAPMVNHRLLGAAASGVEHTEALFDLSGIAVRAPSAAGTGITIDERRQLIDRRCVRPFFWDPLGAPGHCDTTMARLNALPSGRLYGLLAAAVLHHPLAYARQRLAHLNSTERWLVPRRWPSAAPPGESETNDVGLASPGRAAGWWQSAGGWIAATPLGWPFAWTIAALTLVAALQPAAASPARTQALALAGSALTLEASFAAISIASDLRYHLWSMLATGLAAVIAGGAGRLDRRALVIGGAVLLLACAAAVAARLVLPPAPASYAAMLG
ncbi:MAG: hypothetical protein ACTHMG_10885 [Sphingomonas sp.]